MKIYSCGDCGRDVEEEDLDCPFCGAELIDDDEENEELTETSDGALVDDEPIGPAPLEYKCVLVFAIVLVLGALAWGWLINSSHVLLK